MVTPLNIAATTLHIRLFPPPVGQTEHIGFGPDSMFPLRP